MWYRNGPAQSLLVTASLHVLSLSATLAVAATAGSNPASPDADGGWSLPWPASIWLLTTALVLAVINVLRAISWARADRDELRLAQLAVPVLPKREDAADTLFAPGTPTLAARPAATHHPLGGSPLSEELLASWGADADLGANVHGEPPGLVAGGPPSRWVAGARRVEMRESPPRTGRVKRGLRRCCCCCVRATPITLAVLSLSATLTLWSLEPRTSCYGSAAVEQPIALRSAVESTTFKFAQPNRSALSAGVCSDAAAQTHLLCGTWRLAL